MKKRFESGAEKRKRQIEREKCASRQRNSLATFLAPISSNKNENSVPKSNSEQDVVSGNNAASEKSRHHDNVDKFIDRDITDSTNTEEYRPKEERNGNEKQKGVSEVSTDCDITGIETNNGSGTEVEKQTGEKKTETQIGVCKKSTNCDFSDDIALWPIHLTDRMIEYYLINKPCNTGDISALRVDYTDRNRVYYRNFSESNFYCLKANGTKQFREWLLFSETSKSVYCYACKLFSKSPTKFVTGFTDWRNVTRALKEHESAQDHFSSMLTLKKRLLITGRIDSHMEKQINSEREYWREVLKRIIATVKLLASLGIAFRGHREGADSKRKGNFLSCIDYLAEFDNFLKNHLQKFNNPGRGNVSYLSHTVCDEFISLMGSEVKKFLITEVRQALYFSIIVDSTPDITHVDQLTLILRFVDKQGDIRERFFGFLAIECHTAAYMEQVVLKSLEDLSIDMKNCRGQTYDNAANMSGKYSGLQARLKEHAPAATFVPCASHTINLIGNCAAESCSGALQYFEFVQNLYLFFSSSTRRWNVFLNSLRDTRSKHLKRISDTRWAARADAVSALKSNYKDIKEALIQISQNDHEKPLSKLQAKKLSENFDEYEIALLTVLWDKLLQRINSVSQTLQDMQSDLLQGTTLLKSLYDFIKDVRNKFDDIENSAKLLTDNRDYKEGRIKKRKLQFGETSNHDTILVGKQSFVVNVHDVICDVLIFEISKRSTVYNEVLKDFQIFFDFHITKDEINECVRKLTTKYQNDIDEEYFKDEVLHFVKHAQEENASNPVEMYKLLVNGLQSTFPNVETILKIFLTMPICNASGERSFSVLKRVKNYLRNSLSQLHLTDLSLMFIENDVVQSLDYEDIISKFSQIKARKVPL